MPQVETGFEPKVIGIAGPTAAGKTAVAVELAASTGGEIVSADSMAVYRWMDIGTAKPTAEERSRARFHLIDVADPRAAFSAGEYQRLAQEAIDGILERGLPAIVTGGSGLYVRAAIDGLDASIPPADRELRRRLAEEAKTRGNASVHARLAVVDPASAERIHPNNLKRVIRALEIFGATGMPASELFEADSKRTARYPGARLFGLALEREALYVRIEERVDSMMAAGLIEEVRWLLEMGVDPALPSMQGLGYKEVIGYLRGEYGRDEAVALIKKNTRRFAKRQLTWFRADSRIEWLDVGGLTAEEVSKTIKERI